MADVKGGLPTKRNTQFQNHEVYMAKLRLGASEVLDASAVLAGAGSSASPVECNSNDHNFLCFYLKANPASSNKSGNGLFIHLTAQKDTGLYNRAIYTTVAVPTGKHPRNPHAIKALLTIADDTCYIMGTGTALLGDVEYPNKTLNGSMGSVYAAQLQIVLGGTSFSQATTKEHAFLRMNMSGGDAGSQGKFINLLSVEGLNVGNKAAKLMICNADVTGGGGAATGGLQVKVNGTQYWLPLYAIA